MRLFFSHVVSPHPSGLTRPYNIETCLVALVAHTSLEIKKAERLYLHCKYLFTKNMCSLIYVYYTHIKEVLVNFNRIFITFYRDFVKTTEDSHDIEHIFIFVTLVQFMKVILTICIISPTICKFKVKSFFKDFNFCKKNSELTTKPFAFALPLSYCVNPIKSVLPSSKRASSSSR